MQPVKPWLKGRGSFKKTKSASQVKSVCHMSDTVAAIIQEFIYFAIFCLPFYLSCVFFSLSWIMQELSSSMFYNSTVQLLKKQRFHLVIRCHVTSFEYWIPHDIATWAACWYLAERRVVRLLQWSISEVASNCLAAKPAARANLSHNHHFELELIVSFPFWRIAGWTRGQDLSGGRRESQAGREAAWVLGAIFRPHCTAACPRLAPTPTSFLPVCHTQPRSPM